MTVTLQDMAAYQVNQMGCQGRSWVDWGSVAAEKGK